MQAPAIGGSIQQTFCYWKLKAKLHSYKRYKSTLYRQASSYWETTMYDSSAMLYRTP